MSRTAAYSEYNPGSVDAMVRDYLPLVKQIALHLSARLPASIELDDLLQVGLMGLLKASESYEPQQGASFATYAGIRIKGAMLDELRRHDWLPRSVQAKLRRVAEAIEAADARVGGPAQDADIARELDMPLADYQELAGELACARMTHLEDLAGEEGMEDHADPLLEVGEEGFREALQSAVLELPEREKLMMSLYYSEGLNLREIGAVMGVSESRVSQLHGQASARLRAALSAWRE